MARIPFPAAVFARVLGNDKTALDYLRQIDGLMIRLEQLITDLPDTLTGSLLTESGEFLSTEGGDTLLLET